MSTPQFQKKAKECIKQASGWEMMQQMDPQGFAPMVSAVKHHVMGNGGAIAFAAALIKHRLADAGVSNLVRGSELLKPYYANMSREGIQAALSGQDMMPKYRQGIGTAALNPSVSGLGDYEISKDLAKRLITQHEKETGVRLKSLDEIRSHPTVKAILERSHPGVLKSELSQNFIRALDEKLQPNPVVEALKRPGRFGIGGVGPDQQRWGGRIGALGALAMGGGIGAMDGEGIHGAVLNGIVQGPEYAAASALGKPDSSVAQKLLNFGIGLKKSVLGQGKLDALRRMRGTAESSQIGGMTLTPENKEGLKSIGYHGLNQLSGELYNLGRDAGTFGGLYRDADPITAAAAGLPPAAQRAQQVDSVADYIHKNWASPNKSIPENIPKNEGLVAKIKRMLGGAEQPVGDVHPAALPSSDRGRMVPGGPDLRSYTDSVKPKARALPTATPESLDRWHNFNLSDVEPHILDTPASRVHKTTGKVVKAPRKLRILR